MKQKTVEKKPSAQFEREPNTYSPSTKTIALVIDLGHRPRRKNESYGDFEWDR